MKRSRRHYFALPLFSCLLAGACLSVGLIARAQDDTSAPFTNSENSGSPSDIGAANASDGPVRLARFSYIQGNVTWRADENAEWSSGTINLPLRQGAQIWVTDGGRAEVQFDDGSLLRLGDNAIATLQTLYSDNQGEFTEVKLTDGLASLRLKNDHSIYQVDTPLVSVKATGPAKLRVGSGDGVEVAVRSGQAAVEGIQGKVTLQSGDFLDLQDDNSPFDVRSLPREDNWERWNDDRDTRLDEAAQKYREHNLPSNIALVATDLDTYGSWRDDPRYGSVWCPRVTVSDWRPYYYGHWTWVNPFGWTWVSEEPWGWAPYHYGTWINASYGWAWVPGPVHQYWCPAAVRFSEFDGRVAWCPLAPAEVRYPSYLSIGFRGGNWAAFFSIGQAAVYYPGFNSYCDARPFRTHYINHVTFANNINHFNSGPNAFNRYQNSAESFAANHNTYLNGRFAPANAYNGRGITVASASAFGGHGQYERATSASAALFQRGRLIGAPPAGHAPVAGPIDVKPTPQALTPTHTFAGGAHPNSAVLNRPVYRMPLNSAIERSSQPMNSFNGGAAANRLNNRTVRPTDHNPNAGIVGSGRANSPGSGIIPGRTPTERTVTPSGRIPNERTTTIPGRNGSAAGAYGAGNSANSGASNARRDIPIIGSGPRNNPSHQTSEQEAAQRARQSLGIGSSRSHGYTGGSDTSGNSSRPNSGYRAPSSPSPGSSYSGRPTSEEGSRRTGGSNYTPPPYTRTPGSSSSETRRNDPSAYSSGRSRNYGNGYGNGYGSSPETPRSSELRYGSSPTREYRRDSAPYSRQSDGPRSEPSNSGRSGGGSSRSSGSSERSRGSSSDSRDRDSDSGSGGSSPTSNRGRGR